MVTIRVLRIRFLMAVVVGQQDNGVRQQISHRVDAVGDQSLRVRENACRDLPAAEKKVDDNADPGASRRGLFPH